MIWLLIIALLIASWIIGDTQQQLAELKRERLVERCLTAPTRRNFSEVEDGKEKVQNNIKCSNNKKNRSKKYDRCD